MKIDDNYMKDHVTAHQHHHNNPSQNTHKPNQYGLSRPINELNTSSQNKNLSFLGDLSNFKLINPIASKHFTTHIILKKLREHFKECWEHDKSTSPKLEFYNHIKNNFSKEPYLDLVSNAANRYKTTRLRISAHDLEIERGRYRNIPREERICSWCSMTIGARILEDECHVLFDCDLYKHLRATLITTLITAPECDDLFSIQSHILHNNLTLRQSLMKLLSPNTATSHNQSDPLTHHHTDIKQDPALPNSKNFKTRSHFSKAICNFIANIFDWRWTLLNESRTYGNTVPTYNPITI